MNTVVKMEQKDKKQKFNVAKDENEEMSMKEYGSAKICNSKIDGIIRISM